MKVTRQAKILEVIKIHAIDTQEELISILEQEGYKVTQATISRDIKDLGLQKALDSDGRYKYIAAQNTSGIKQNFKAILHGSVLSAESAQNLVIIKTHAGMAQAVCVAMDNMHFQGIVGTLAGDDTIFAATKASCDAEEVCKELNKLL